VERTLGGRSAQQIDRFEIAKFAAPPFAVLFAALAVSTWFRSRIGLWICLALGVAPIILVVSNIARHSA